MTYNNYDFSSFTGKMIDVESYYYSLTEKAWKFDTEESNLFIALSKTFWKENIKVWLAFEEWCCVPPNKESTKIEYVNFYKFDPVVFKQKNIYTEYEGLYQEDECRDFETAEDYIKWMNHNYPHYIPYADFNTEDYKLLTATEVQNIPIEIQKQVWEDLHSVMPITSKAFKF